jgi:hypothetical protein
VRYPEAAELTAMKALVVAIDACYCKARDHKALYVNDVFHALACRWSPTYRGRNAPTIWGVLADRMRTARREMLEAGVDLARIWDAVCDGVDGLYKAKMIGGPGRTRGRRVELCRRSTRFLAYEKLLRHERVYQRPRQRTRILPADAPTPELKIAKWTIAERDYDVMTVGEPTKRVIDILESTRLFLNVNEVRADAAELTARAKAHPWRRIFHAWAKRAKHEYPDRAEFQKARKAFLSEPEHKKLRKEYRSLDGRRVQAVTIYRQIRRHRIDSEGHLEVKTAYYKTRGRRFQPRHVWPPRFHRSRTPNQRREHSPRSSRPLPRHHQARRGTRNRSNDVRRSCLGARETRNGKAGWRARVVQSWRAKQPPRQLGVSQSPTGQESLSS